MILIFDLDHTLYDEFDFVRGGLRAVAEHLSPLLQAPAPELYEEMWNLLQKEGRGSVFDETLRAYGKLSKANVARCLAIYRLHKPSLTLYPDAERCLSRFKSIPLYIVTDGNKI